METKQQLGQPAFFPVPPEILHFRGNLQDPSNPNKFHPFDPYMFKIMCSFFEIFNPLLYGPGQKRNITYPDIYERTNIPESTIYKKMPILLYNFKGKYFTNIKKTFGGCYEFEFYYDFQFKAQGRGNMAVTLQDQINYWMRNCNEVDLTKWAMFEKIPMASLKKQWDIFQKFVNHEFDFWKRNIDYTRSEFKRNKWREVPLGWMFRCLEQDYAFNKLDRSDKKEALNGTAALFQNRGIDIDKIFKPA